MNIKLMANYFVVVNPLWVAPKSKGGLLIPEMARNKKESEEVVREKFEKTKKLKVIKTGDACTKIKEGDTVYIHSNALPGAQHIEFGEGDQLQGYMIFQEPAVVFIYGEEDKKEEITKAGTGSKARK